MSSFNLLTGGTTVQFSLENSFPLLTERYAASDAGVVEIKGLFNQKAHLETLHGQKYRMRSPRRDPRYLNQLVYPIVQLPGQVEVFCLRTPMITRSEQRSMPLLRFVTLLDDESFVFKRTGQNRREFEVWDGMEIQRLVQRGATPKLVADAMVLQDVPDVLVLLLPWLDSQSIASHQ